MKELENKLFGYATLHDGDSCWYWTGGYVPCPHGNGYGVYNYEGKLWYAHRLAYRMWVGKLESSPPFSVDHLCGNTICINPDHLTQVIHRKNVLRGIGPTALNSRKTHCKRGHSLQAGNLVSRKDGYRACRKCNRNYANNNKV